MVETGQLPRQIKLTGGDWPAQLVTQIRGHQPCRHCAHEIAYFHTRDLTGHWAHTGTETTRCATEKFELAEPIPRCPQCQSLHVIRTQQAWGNATDCPDCGYHNFVSIGD